MNSRIILTVGILLSLTAATLLQAQEADSKWENLLQEANELYREGEYERGIVVAKKAIEVAEASFGPDHPNVAQSLNNLAAIYDTQGEYAKAEPLYKRSLAIREKSLGVNHPDVAQSLNNLAVLYMTQGDYAKASDSRSWQMSGPALTLDSPREGR